MMNRTHLSVDGERRRIKTSSRCALVACLALIKVQRQLCYSSNFDARNGRCKVQTLMIGRTSFETPYIREMTSDVIGCVVVPISSAFGFCSGSLCFQRGMLETFGPTNCWATGDSSTEHSVLRRVHGMVSVHSQGQGCDWNRLVFRDSRKQAIQMLVWG